MRRDEEQKLEENRQEPPSYFFFPRTRRLPRTSDVIRVHSPNADLIQSPCDRLLSPYLAKLFLLENPQEPTLQRSQ